MKRSLPLVASALAILATALGGCASTKNQPPALVRAAATEGNTTSFSALRTEYENAMTAKNYAAAKVPRNRMIQVTRYEIDLWYADIEKRLYEQRAGFNTLADFAELSLAGATALVHGEEAKTVLATILTVGKGTRLSVDKNWFREKATESLINTMRSSRNTVLAEIITKATNYSADRYTFEEAQGDLVAYFQAGTIPSALVALAASSGDKVTESEEEVKQANEARYLELYTATAADVDVASQLRTTAGSLNEKQARAALTKLKVPIPDDASFTAIRALLAEQVRRLATANADEYEQIRQAVTEAATL